MGMNNYLDLINKLGIKGRLSTDQYIGLCPLHDDHNPSFSVSVKTGMWMCFSKCGSGTFNHLVMKVYGLSLKGALEWQGDNISTAPVMREEEKISTETPHWLRQWHLIDRKVMPRWWFDRGFTWEIAEKWDIRYDEIRGRVVIPYYDHHGNFLGTITRNLIYEPKYINSPGLARSEHLFGLKAQPNRALILITEGPLDCITIDERTQHKAVALLGVNFSEEHARILQHVDEVCLALDNDEAGEIAIQKITNQLITYGRVGSQISRLHLPEGKKDVGELTAQELEQVISARSIV